MTSRNEAHPEPIPFENRLGLVGLLHRDQPGTYREHKKANRRHEAAGTETCEDLAPEPPLLVGGDEPTTGFRQGQACRLALADDPTELRVASELGRCCDRLLT